MTSLLILHSYIWHFIYVIQRKINVEFDLLYLDNGVNNGASGGPVANAKGEAIGIIKLLLLIFFGLCH